MKRAWIALLLLALLLTCLPLGAAAEEKSVQASPHEQMLLEAAELYRKARRTVGVSSFHGLCGTMVNAQTYLLGIDTQRYSWDGKAEFDFYSKMELTEGGYRVRSFPASSYSLRQALNAVTACGKVDAYNLVVGFERTTTSRGQFGHTLLINGIIDGTVYFTESYDLSLGGKYWSEGTPIYCDMDTFCAFYEGWTQFDGLIYFGRCPGTTVTEQYDTAAYALTNRETPIYTVLQEAESAQAALELEPGTGMVLKKILRTADGWWYEAQWQEGLFYVPADRLTVLTSSDFTPELTDFRGPTVLWAGVGCVLRGTVWDRGKMNVTAEVLDETGHVVQSSSLSGVGSVDLRKLSTPMSFGSLDAGLYHLRITASREVCTLLDRANAIVDLSSQERELWNGEFRIVKSGERYVTLRFLSDRGRSEVDQVILPRGTAPESLPTASKSGYMLLGWSTEPGQQELVAEQTVFDKDTTLYACWAEARRNGGGWQYTSGDLFYAGSSGWIRSNGFQFYLDERGMPLRMWQELEGKQYYFNEYGVLRTGWTQLDGALRYLDPHGGWPEGWATVDGQLLCFGEGGAVKLGWVRRNGKLYRQFTTESGPVSRYMPCLPDDFSPICKAAIPMPAGR